MPLRSTTRCGRRGKSQKIVGLSDKSNKFPTQLSGGERQRVSIARSVARQPKILIADEPTGNLDVLTRKEIIDLLQKINDFGTTLLVTTHDENIVNNLSKRVITLKAGRIVDDQKYHGVYRLDGEDEQSLKKSFVPNEQEPEEFQAPIIIRQQPIITTSRNTTKHTAAADERPTAQSHPQMSKTLTALAALLGATVAVSDGKLTLTQEQADKLESAVAAHQTTVADLNAKITEKDSKINELNNKIADLVKAPADTTTDVTDTSKEEKPLNGIDVDKVAEALLSIIP